MVSFLRKLSLVLFALAVSGCSFNDGPPGVFPGASETTQPNPAASAPTPSEAVTPGAETSEGEGEPTLEEEGGTETEEEPGMLQEGEGETTSGSSGKSSQGKGGGKKGPPAEEPEVRIVRYSADSRCVRPESTVTLRWKVEDAESISITAPSNPSINRICYSSPCTGSSTVQLFSTATYTLRASSGARSVTRSLTITVEEVEFEAEFDSIVERDGTNDVAYSDGKFYLATQSGLKKYSNGSTTSLSGDGLPSAAMKSVTVDIEDPDVIYASATGHLYESIDGGDTWDTIHLETPGGDHLDTFAVASKNEHCAVGTERGIYHGHVGENFYPTDLSSGSVKRLFASDEGFFAIKGSTVYWSPDGDNWDASLTVGSPRFFQEVAGKIFVITGEGAYEWDDGSWSYFDDEVDGPSAPVKAVGSWLFMRFVAAGNQVWAKSFGTTWERAILSGNVPEIKGFYKSAGLPFSNYVWGPDGVYRWKVRIKPLSCDSN